MIIVPLPPTVYFRLLFPLVSRQVGLYRLTFDRIGERMPKIPSMPERFLKKELNGKLFSKSFFPIIGVKLSRW